LQADAVGFEDVWIQDHTDIGESEIPVSVLESAPDSALERTARHPRLGTPMRLIDIAFFTAEHDDHHLSRITELMRVVR